MTSQIEKNPFDLAMELVMENGFNGIADAVSYTYEYCCQIRTTKAPESRAL
jgi:hypothetical protein